jgi:ABC-type bacteriocin/lantibiotic exporter with double-glycine peptidase domain
VLTLTKRLGLHQIIDQLPKKYHTNVGEKGNIFSGGEKQRIGLIRALLRKPKVLLLDEPTSSLDVQTQQAVGILLSELKNTTRIMITHREGILDYCDNVIRIGN